MAGFYDTIVARYGECVPDCILCEDACIKAKDDEKCSRIQTVHLPEVGFHGVVKCLQCSEPACREVCPNEAIYKSDQDGIVRIIEEKCVGCGLCTLACSYGGVYYDPERNKSYKCDKCNGDPKCVEACKYDVLTYAQSRPIFDCLGEERQAHGVLSCQGCGEELAIRFALRVLGKKIVLFGGPGCSILTFMGTTMGCAVDVPTIGGAMTNLPAIASGVGRYLKKTGQEATLVVLAGDGITCDIGFQCLSGAAERGENMVYICLDNEAYMNTGIQRSSSTPFKSWSSTTPVGKEGQGKKEKPKYVPLLMAFHNIPYAATASISFLNDFTQKLLKAKEASKDGLAYIHLITPCPTGWRSPMDSTIELARMAVETNYFPLWEAKEGRFRSTYIPRNPKPIADFTNLMGRFSHLTEDDLKEVQKIVDDRYNLIQSLADIT